MRKNSHDKILKNEPKEEHINTVPKGPFGNIILVPIWIQRLRCVFLSCFLLSRISRRRQNLLFMRQMSLFTHYSGTTYVLFIGPIVTLFRKNIKNGSHGIIYTFKNYFTTVFSVFNFSNNKFNPNGSPSNIICIFFKIRVSKNICTCNVD